MVNDTSPLEKLKITFRHIIDALNWVSDVIILIVLLNNHENRIEGDDDDDKKFHF